MPGSCRHTTSQKKTHMKPPSAPPQTPNRLPARPLQEEVVGGMRCCGGVLRRRKRPAQAATRDVCHIGPPHQDGTSRPESRSKSKRPRTQQGQAQTQHGHPSFTERTASDPEPPARTTASRRSGRRHAVLRRCAEAVQTANSRSRALSQPQLKVAARKRKQPDRKPLTKCRRSQHKPQ